MALPATYLTAPLSDYLKSVSLRENAALKELRHALIDLPEAKTLVSQEKGQFLALLVQLTNARKILDIGSYPGYAALSMAAAMPEESQITCCDISHKFEEKIKPLWQKNGLMACLDLHIGPAAQSLDILLKSGGAGRYDLAFIDADKINYPDYFEKCMSLVRSGGLIILNDIFLKGQITDAADRSTETVAIRSLNEALHKDLRISLSVLPIGNGLSLALKQA